MEIGKKEQSSMHTDFSNLDAMIEENFNEGNIGYLYNRLDEEVRNDNVTRARYLIEKANLDVGYPGILDGAIMDNHMEMTTMLIEHGADVKKCTRNLAPVLVNVCMAYGTKEGNPNYTDMIELLLKNGATLFYDGKDYGKCLCDDSKPPQFLCSPEARELLAKYLPDKQNRYCDIENGKKLWRPHPHSLAERLEEAKRICTQRNDRPPQDRGRDKGRER
ncbi:MAG: hypothetical protein RSD07_06685 [Angelakisella sp.]